MLAEAMEAKEVFMLVGLFINFAAMIGGAVFVVASVRATTAVLASQVKSLHYAIDRLTNTHDRLDGKVSEHGNRLTHLETKAHAVKCDN
jgi:hypothetical protein